MNILLLAMIIVIVGSVLVRGSTRPRHAPRSPAYTAYRNRLQRNIFGAVAMSIVAAVVLFANTASTSVADADRLRLPEMVKSGLEFLIIPGIYLLPLLALCLTEFRSRPEGRRVATLAPRGIRTLAPTWLLAVTAVVTVFAILATFVTLTPELRTSTDFSAPQIDSHYEASGNVWKWGLFTVIALVLTAATVRQTIKRPDLDPDTQSDKWSRSGVVTRSLCLLLIAALYGIGTVTNQLNVLGWAYSDYREGGGVPIANYGWVEDLRVQTATSWVAGVVMVSFLATLVIFAMPPRQKNSAPSQGAERR